MIGVEIVKEEKAMKKGIMLVFVVLLFGMLMGCAGRSSGSNDPEKVNAGTGKPDDKKQADFIPEDYRQGSGMIMQTEKGYYYLANDKTGGLHYVDKLSGRDMYLCNKPECKHDGNAFCVATNDKYRIFRCCIYNDRILASAIETTETKYLFKLISIALDGSATEELATYFTLEQTGVTPVYFLDEWQRRLCIHRNKALIPMGATGESGLEDSNFYGAAVVDLDTGKVSYLDEEPLSRENAKVINISAYGEYLYYCRKEGKKTLLYRYHITDGTQEKHKLLVGFSGEYAVINENTIVYLKRDGDTLCVYDFKTGLSEEKKKLKRTIVSELLDGSTFETVAPVVAERITTDGTYLYVMPRIAGHAEKVEETGEKIIRYEKWLYVFDYNLEDVVDVDLSEKLTNVESEHSESLLQGSVQFLSYCGEDIYAVLYPGKYWDVDDYIFQCKRSDLLAGKPEFTFVYSDLYHKD